MAPPPSSGDVDVPRWILDAARAVRLNEIRVRWKVMLVYRKWRWLRRELVPASRRFEHQICPGCGAVQEAGVTACAACGERIGSTVTRGLRALGLSIPTVVSVSSLLGIAMIAIYGRMILARPGQGILTWDVATLVAFGADWFPAVRAGQWWRMATACFLHIGLWHLAFNLVALSQIGPSIEEVFGRGRMVFLFMVTGVLANVASTFLNAGAVSAGASGALMGLIGVAAGWGHRLGTTHGRDVRDQMLKWGAYTVFFGFAIHADNVAHVAGLVVGAALGYAFRPETLEHTKASRSSVVMGALGTISVIATCALVLRPPAASLESARRMAAEEAEPPRGESEDDEEGGLPDFVEACALHRSGKTAEAIARLGMDKATGVDARAFEQVLEGTCAQLDAMRERCARFRDHGEIDPAYAKLPREQGEQLLRDQCRIFER